MQHSFKIHHKNTLLTPELTKSQYKPPMRSKFNRNFNFRDHTYIKFKNRRQPKVGLLNRKTMLQHYLSQSVTLWSQQNDFFDAMNRQKRPQMSEVDQKLVVKLRLGGNSTSDRAPRNVFESPWMSVATKGISKFSDARG